METMKCDSYAGNKDFDNLGGASSSPNYRKQVLDLWEPESYRRRLERQTLSDVQPDVGQEITRMPALISSTKAYVEQQVSGWPTPPSTLLCNALAIVCHCVTERCHWSPTDDLLATQLAALMFVNEFRAHSDGFRCYQNGAFRRLDELQEPTVRAILTTLDASMVILKHVSTEGTQRECASVMQAAAPKAHEFQYTPPLTSGDLRPPRADEGHAVWALDARRGLQSMKCRFGGREASRDFVHLRGRWMQMPLPDIPMKTITFDDCTLVCHPDVRGPGRLKQIPKSHANLCYFGIP